MEIAKLDDINKEFAARAFHGTSFDPEKRGEARRQAYVDAVNGLYAELLPLATTEELQKLLAAEMETFRQGVLKRMNAFLSSHSNVMSPMITGPARFPVERNRKRGEWADNKAATLWQYVARGKVAIKRKLADAQREPVAGEISTLFEIEGAQVVSNVPADRVQIIFDGKPSPEMIAALKGAAWKWSPRNMAWQRKLTPNAQYSAKRILGVA